MYRSWKAAKLAAETKIFFVKHQGYQPKSKEGPHPNVVDIDEFVRTQQDDPGEVYIKIKLEDISQLQALVKSDGSILNKHLLEALMHLLVPRNLTVGAAQEEYVLAMQ